MNLYHIEFYTSDEFERTHKKCSQDREMRRRKCAAKTQMKFILFICVNGLYLVVACSVSQLQFYMEFFFHNAWNEDTQTSALASCSR